jgi:hypothetical protein
MSMNGARVASIYRYPVKGLTGERLDSAELAAGATIAFDRAYAIENGPGRFDPDKPKYLPKVAFLMLMRDERLATLQSRFDEASRTLTILRDGKQVARGALDTAIGRKMLEQFFAAYMKAELRGAPKIVSADGHSFSDVASKCLHIVNLATVRDIERVVGRTVDPLRFRANVYLDGLEPWAEFKWLDKSLRVGSAALSVFARTQRCEATNVDPANGARDMAVPAVLMRQFGHSDFGVYAKVTSAGRIAAGDACLA